MPTLESQPEPAAESQSTATAPRVLTGEEQALYDRQIRLWGVEAQRKLATSTLLLVGDAHSLLLQELSKNIVLAGISRLAISHIPSPTHNPAERPGFLGADCDAVVASLRDMNPLVDIAVSASYENESELGQFSAVCVIAQDVKQELAIADRCRAVGTPFSCGRVAGEVGWVFLDAGDKHHYSQKDPQNSGKTVALDTSFVSYRAALDAPWGREVQRGEFGWHIVRTLQHFQETHGHLPMGDGDVTEVEAMYERLAKERSAKTTKVDFVRRAARSAAFVLPPVAAILGGLWGREAVKIVSGKDAPINNLFFYNASTSAGSVEMVGTGA